jgi:KDO2-lipid IV(A) lauroyltransferase
MTSVAQRAQVAAVRALMAILGAMPWRIATGVGALAGRLGYRPFGVRRRVVERQIAAAFPEWTTAQVTQCASDAYASLGRTAFETMLLPTLDARGVIALVERCDGFEFIERAMAGGKGLVIAAGHLGNWELAGAYLAARGIPTDAIYFPATNTAFNDFLEGTRKRFGVRIHTVWEAVRTVPRALREGRSVAFLMDQALVGLSAESVSFFGRPAFSPRGAAVMALRLGAPMVFGAPLRQPDGRFRIAFSPVEIPSTGDKDADVATMVADYTRSLEAAIREAPAQYFWHHRRWKRQPEGTPSELLDPTR